MRRSTGDRPAGPIGSEVAQAASAPDESPKPDFLERLLPFMRVQGLILVLLLPWFARAQQQEQYYGTRLSAVALAGADSQDDLQSLPIHISEVITLENV